MASTTQSDSVNGQNPSPRVLTEDPEKGYHGDHVNPRQVLTVSQVPNPAPGRANPGPLGLFGFALTTWILGLYQCGVGLPDRNPEGKVGPFQVVFGSAIFMGGTAQFVAGILEFACGNTFGLTVHCSYGAFWLSFAMLLVPSLDIQAAYGTDIHAYHVHVGIYLILWCWITAIFLIAALKTNVAIVTTFFFLTLAFLFLAIAQFIAVGHPKASEGTNKAGGAFAIICAFTAFWAGANGLFKTDKTYFEVPVIAIPSAGGGDVGGRKARKVEHTA